MASMNLRPRSPLAMVLLALLAERPMHPYRMQQLIKSRRKDDVVNVARSNSVYQVIDRLLRDALIRVRETDPAGTGPSRTVYEITPKGRTTFDDWMGVVLAEPAREFPEFRAAVAISGILPPEVVRGHLARRIPILEQQLTDADETSEVTTQLGLPRVLTLENEHKAALARAELDWLRRVVADLESGTLTWSPDELVALSDHLEPESQTGHVAQSGQ